MKEAISNIWAKTPKGADTKWHPLALHMLDVAATADAILLREPESTRIRTAEILGLEWEHAHPWLLLLVACHDLGKACPGFQNKWPERLASTGLRLQRSPSSDVNHAFVSQMALSKLLQDKCWPPDLAELAADAVGCHHGSRASEREKEKATHEIYVGRGERLEVVRNDWDLARQTHMELMIDVFNPTKAPEKATFSGPDFMLLAGLTSFADWIGSNEAWFPYGNAEDCTNPAKWFHKSRSAAGRALDTIGWEPRKPLSSGSKSFDKVFSFPPRPLQTAVAEALATLTKPAVLLVEAPMGEGKTEAAFFAFLELQRRFAHRGMYIALPTKATGNAMFTRTLKFLRSQGSNRTLDLQLLHGATLLNDTFQNLRLAGIYDPISGGEIRAGEWFTHKKRALLSEYGVGTIDQAILPILPVRHQFVRLWGLANRVVVFDEIHAYDAYTGTLLVHLLRWLLALGSSVILLSATLPPSIRRKLAGIVNSALPDKETEYPRLSVFFPGDPVYQKHFAADPARRQILRLKMLPPELSDLLVALDENLIGGGMALALLNTVQRAQELYRLFPEGEPIIREGHRVGKRLPSGTEVYLFHARFPAEWRQKREDHALETFGVKGSRSGRKLLIATQVAEQSLDLDFDLIATDLAPIDLILQRAGRLWRHTRESRPIAEPRLLVLGLTGDLPPSFGKPLWWGAVYREDILLRTWSLLRTKQTLTLPDEIDPMVQAVYEEEVELAESLRGRLEKALVIGEGENTAQKIQANQAIIGLPDDGSWNDPARFVLYDEDEPGVHRTLMAQTRLGEETAVAIPIFQKDNFNSETRPNDADAKELFLRALSLSRKGVVKKLKAAGVPEGWKKSPLLRNCFPLQLDEQRVWLDDASVRLDEDLGLVYEPKEAN